MAEKSDKEIHLKLTPLQANSVAISVKLVKEMLAVPENTAVYPNLGDFKLERSLIKAQLDDTQETLRKQLKDQMPTE